MDLGGEEVAPNPPIRPGDAISVEAAMRSAPGKGQAAQIEIKPLSNPIAHDKHIAARIYPSSDGPRQANFRVVS